MNHNENWSEQQYMNAIMEQLNNIQTTMKSMLVSMDNIIYDVKCLNKDVSDIKQVVKMDSKNVTVEKKSLIAMILKPFKG